MSLPPRRKGKEIPRLPLSAFTDTGTGTSDTFPIPPTPSFVSPYSVVDSHLQVTLDPCHANIAHLNRAQKRAVVLSPKGHPADVIISSLQSLQLGVVDAPVLAVSIPFVLNATQVPGELSVVASPALTAVYDGAIPVAPEAEGDNKDRAQVENSVKNLHWALRHARVVDLDIKGGIVAVDASGYDSLVNLLAKAIKSDTNTSRTPIVLTNVLPPPLDSVVPVVTMMNHPTYTTYRQRTSSLSLFQDVYVKLLPPVWVSAESTGGLGEKQEKDLKNLLKLFIVPVLEAFGFERIIFGSSPAFDSGSPTLAETWYKLVLESFRELAVSQDEMDKIFCENAERVYSSSQ